MAFGRGEFKRIRAFFDFTSFRHTIATPVKMLPSNSANGRIAIIMYAREKYNAAAMLKLTKKADTDSPYYEFTVGRFVNEHLINAFPCFTETYGLLELDKATYHTLMKPRGGAVDLGVIRPPLFCDSNAPLAQLTSDRDLIRRACAAAPNLGLIAQFFDNTWSMNDLAKQNPKLAAQDALLVLFQIYGPLGAIHNQYTHYDLHGGNVLLVPAPHGTCIQMHYHMPDGTSITFKTKYITKIIDYGRCFFDAGLAGESSTHLSKVLCGPGVLCPYTKTAEDVADGMTDAEVEFMGTCGRSGGYWLDPVHPDAPLQITPIKKNRSIDLVCAYYFLKAIKNKDKTGVLEMMYNQLPPILGPHPYNLAELPTSTKYINTVTDLGRVLVSNMVDPAWVSYNEHCYSNIPVHGQLHVYLSNRPGVSIVPMRWE